MLKVIIEMCVLIMAIVLFLVAVFVVLVVFYFNNYGFIFLSIVSLLYSFLSSSQMNASCIFFIFDLGNF